MALGFTSQPLDVSTMSRVHLELMVSELTKANYELFAENEEMKANNKELLRVWREAIVMGSGAYHLSVTADGRVLCTAIPQ